MFLVYEAKGGGPHAGIRFQIFRAEDFGIYLIILDRIDIQNTLGDSDDSKFSDWWKNGLLFKQDFFCTYGRNFSA